MPILRNLATCLRAWARRSSYRPPPGPWITQSLATTTKYRDKWLKPYQTIASLYNMVIVSVTSVGVIVGGPYQEHPTIFLTLVKALRQLRRRTYADYDHIVERRYGLIWLEPFVAVFVVVASD